MQVRTTTAVLTELVTALDNDEFEPVFQPIVSLKNRNIIGFEALARWRRPDGALLSPAAFAVGLADAETEARISEAIALKVVAAAVKLRASGLEFGRLAINLAANHLEDAVFAKHFLAMVEAAGLPATDFSVEIRETTRLDPHMAQKYLGLKLLAEAGVWVALDDFGAGYAGLSQLLLPFLDRVKIDMSLTRASVQSERARLIVEHCLRLGDDLGLDVVAEGVEDVECERLLIELGCPAAQGFLYARPAGLAQAMEQLRPGARR